MNKGVEILLERIKTNPEEFIIDDNQPFTESRWRKILRHYKEYLEPEDMKVLDDAINKLLQEEFTTAVMEELLDPKAEEPLTLAPSSSGLTGTNTLSGGATQGASSGSGSVIISSGGTSVTFNSVHPNGRVSPMVTATKKSFWDKILNRKGSNP